MADGDLDAEAVFRLAVQSKSDGQRAVAADLLRAKNALRVKDQLTAAELQFCTAFQLDPFAYLSAKLEDAATGAIAGERQDRIDRAAFRAKEQAEQQAWGLAEMERLKNA